MQQLDWVIRFAGVIVAVVAVVAIVHRIRWYRAESDVSRQEVGSKQKVFGRTEGLLPPTSDQCSFVRERVKRYCGEMLRYEIGLERHRRNASRELLLKVLAGRSEVISMPILYLNSEEWVWEQSQLREAVKTSLRELGLSVPPDRSEPTAQAAHACEEWAAAEARREFDEFLDTDPRG